ncbi:MAG: hypothetical protein PHX87_05065 [Candidatus Peribacteraceae bacterium]|nr:hypothetical protein [Candidatus Peribacteraceae bacterium]MDD5742766.1 hypothetical protein [Candidatus Peribacteraceae bacterium]
MKNRHATRKATVEARKAQEQSLLLEQFRKLPVVSVACEKTGIGRASYYRWRQEDPKFATAADEALTDGTNLVSDMAESQLLSQIRDGNLGAVMYWLKHRNPHYNNKLEVTARLKHENDNLTPEQEAAITEALRLASLTEDDPSTSSISLPPSSHGTTPTDAADSEAVAPDVQG